MSRFDDIGLFWEDLPSSRKRGERELGPIPPIPETGWKPPTEMPDIRQFPVVALDTETYDPELAKYGPGWARNSGHIVGISVAVPGHRWYFPMRHEVEPELNLDPDMVLRWADVMLRTDKPKVGANLIYDIGWLQESGVAVGGELMDVQFAEALLNESSKVNLEQLGVKYTGQGKETDILKEWCMNYYGSGVMNWRKDIYRAPVSLVGAYGEQDASLPLEVIEKQWPLLRAEGLMDLFKLENKMIRLLVEMRCKGVSIDVDKTEQLRDRLRGEQREIQERLDAAAGKTVNVNSGASLAKMFDANGLSYPRTKASKNHPNGQPSFQKEFLAAHPHELPQMVTQIRGLDKLVGTFVEGAMLGSHVDGKIHGSFHPLSGTDGGAKTGRLASSNPNLQNIPMRSEIGKIIRAAFVPDAGHVQWRKYDYSQIEYRLLAHFATGAGATDPSHAALAQAAADAIRADYNADPKTDYHDKVIQLVKEMTGIDLERSAAKNINFGIAYGMGIAKLAKDLGVSIAQAEELMKAYHQGVPFAKTTMDYLSDFAQTHGYNVTILGRRTRFNTWEPASFMDKRPPVPYERAVREYGVNIKRAYLYRTLNYTLQGSSADMMKAAMVKCYEDGVFDVTGIPRLTVHDELDFSVAELTPAVEEGFREMRHIMQTVIPLRVPVICDLETGPSWGEVKEAA